MSAPRLTRPSSTPPRRPTSTKKVVLAWGTLVGVGALATTAAFTDQAFLNLGTDGLGGEDTTYNIQVGATDADGAFVPGEWQEADVPVGVDIAIDGASTIFPGSAPITVDIPVRNDSPLFGSTLALQLNDVGGAETDAAFRDALLFDVADAGGASATDLTFATLSTTGFPLSPLAVDEETTVTLTISLPSGDDDNALQGLGALLQAQFDGSSTN